MCVYYFMSEITADRRNIKVFPPPVPTTPVNTDFATDVASIVCPWRGLNVSCPKYLVKAATLLQIPAMWPKENKMYRSTSHYISLSIFAALSVVFIMYSCRHLPRVASKLDLTPQILLYRVFILRNVVQLFALQFGVGNNNVFELTASGIFCKVLNSTNNNPILIASTRDQFAWIETFMFSSQLACYWLAF